MESESKTTGNVGAGGMPVCERMAFVWVFLWMSLEEHELLF